MMRGSPTHPDLAAALRERRRAFASVALFSGMVNLLMLAGSALHAADL
jgi:ABC-type protease/lipase transport system fused ATPase/permease subunit